MEQFTLEKYLKNPNRKVVTRDGRAVRILCTDAKAKDGCCIIAAIETDGEEEGYQFFKDGTAYSSKSSIEDCADLFFVDEEEELTEFEKVVQSMLNEPHFQDIEAVKQFSKTLLNLARKEILESLPKWKTYEGELIGNGLTFKDNVNLVLVRNGYYIDVNELDKLPKEE